MTGGGIGARGRLTREPLPWILPQYGSLKVEPYNKCALFLSGDAIADRGSLCYGNAVRRP